VAFPGFFFFYSKPIIEIEEGNHESARLGKTAL
jgi:hypothetical protein